LLGFLCNAQLPLITTLFPYSTLFRSRHDPVHHRFQNPVQGVHQDVPEVAELSLVRGSEELLSVLHRHAPVLVPEPGPRHIHVLRRFDTWGGHKNPSSFRPSATLRFWPSL